MGIRSFGVVVVTVVVEVLWAKLMTLAGEERLLLLFSRSMSIPHPRTTSRVAG